MRHLAACPLFLAALLCTCGRDLNDNPYDPGYVGNYEIVITWPGPVLNAETLTAYRLAYAVGTDEFEAIEVRTEPPGFVDQGLFTAETARDSLTLYFKAVFEGVVYVTGRTPNARQFADSCIVRVTNPFSVQGDSVVAVGDTLSLRVTRPGGFGTPVPEIIWISSGKTDTIYANEAWEITASAVGDMSVSATVRDWRGNLLPLDTFTVSIPGRAPRIISVAFVSDTLAAGDTAEARVVVDDSDGGALTVRFGAPAFGWSDSVTFVSRMGRLDTVTFRKFLTDTGVLEAQVRVTDDAGLYSAAGSAQANVVRFDYFYELAFAESPDQIVINRPAFWTVTAGPARSIQRYNPLIEWRILASDGADTLLDSAAAGLDSVCVTAGDSADVRVSVRAADSDGRVSRTVEAMYAVRLYRPWCAVSSAPDTMGNFQAESLKVVWGDSVGDVVAVRLEITKDGAGIIDTTAPGPDTAFVFSFSDSGRYDVAAWALDSDSLISDTARVSIQVLEFRPRVEGTTVEPPMVYRGDWVDLCADVERSQSGAPVTRVLWDFDGDTSVWDVDTTAVCVRRAFPDTGTNHFVVACEDSAGMRSLPANGSVRALDDRPVIERFVYTTVWFNDDTAFSVEASDPNGSLTQISVDWGDDSPVSTKPVSGASVLELFNHRYVSPGPYAVTVTAVDDKSVTGSGSYQVVARQGKPRVRPVGTFSGDTLYAQAQCYIGEFPYCTGTAFCSVGDTNGTVENVWWCFAEPFDTSSGCAAQAEGVDTFSVALDETHCGIRRSALIAVDDDGVMSTDTFWLKVDCQ